MNPTCTAPNCDREIHVKKWELCAAHNLQRRLGKPLTPIRRKKAKERTICPVEGCEKQARSRGLCTSHASVCWRMSVHPSDLPRLLASSCALCTSPAPLLFDHDHACCPGNYSCGSCLRGVLCPTCNQRIERPQFRTPQIEDYLRQPPGVDTRPYKPATVDNHPGRVRP